MKKLLALALLVPSCTYSFQAANTRPQAHIQVVDGLPGIIGLLEKYTDTGKALRALAQALLRGDQSNLSQGERELIASYVSSLNKCNFCCNSHGAAAANLLDGNYDLVQAVNNDYQAADVSDKMKALLNIAGKVQNNAGSVDAQDIAQARAQGATDQDIHDAVLIAAAFCMYNRYVDGLSATAPADMQLYDQAGKQLAEHGYVGNRS
ncbi:MAG: peroxidase-related enzyme [Candidatus Babeliales bacterium]|nr:peroxidase-related enzyme [Candidatus Babeliales bacterium]